MLNLKRQKPDGTHKADAQGFTLIEISIIILISGIIFVPMINMYHNYYKQQLIEKTRDSIDFSQSIIATFASNRYPCPADPTLGPNDAAFGLEQRDTLTGNCIIAPGKVISVPGARTAAEAVFIGTIPIRTLKAADPTLSYVPDSASLDAWGNKLLYAVTANQTNGATYSSDNGQIAAIDENDPPRATAGINGDGHFVILSHGRNGNGAYSYSGALVSACGTTSKEDENCDGDSMFMSALGFYEGSGVNPDYFDDIVYFVQKTNNQLWDNVTPGSNDIFNTNSGNVGIKTATPAEKLDVNGNLQASNNTKVAQICDYNGAKCFNVDKISGTGMTCPTNQVMVGITNGNADCAPVAMTPLTDTTCATGKWIQGIRSDGTVICTP